MVDFKIRRGLSSTLFAAPGVFNPKLVVDEGCWYLCTDTAELFLGVKVDNDSVTLKRINDIRTEVTNEKLQAALEKLEKEVQSLESTELYKKISSESELPTNFNTEEFNPNITYYIPLTDGKISTYIFDKEARSYMCTNSVDELVVRAMVNEAVQSTLETLLVSQLPEAVINTIEGVILHGGDATPRDD